MWIVIPNDVLGKIVRLHELADVVKVSACTAHRAVCADFICRSLGKIRYDVTMMPGARRFQAQTQQQRVVAISHLKPGHVGCYPKSGLEHWQRAADDHCRYDSSKDRRCGLLNEHGHVHVTDLN